MQQEFSQARNGSTLGVSRSRSLHGIAHPFRITTTERPGIALLRYFLFPLSAVATLFIVAALFSQPFTRSYWILTVLAFALSWRLLDAAEFRELRPLAETEYFFPKLLLRWSNVLAFIFFIGFAAKASEQFSRAVILVWAVATPVCYALLREVSYRALCQWNRTGCVARTHVIVGTNVAAREFAARLQRDSSLGTFIGFFAGDRADETQAQRPRITDLLGGIDGVVDYVRRHSIDVVHIALPIADRQLLDQLLNALRDTTTSVYFLPDVPIAARNRVSVIEMADTPLLIYFETPYCGLDGVAKRAIDIAVGGALVLFLSPLLLVLALLVRLDSPGPIIFKQRRYGMNGEEIAVYKFRTMTVCEDGDKITQVTRDDARVTRLGKFLRSSSLDELPQLFCVLGGSMSLVGPRPHAIAHNEMYRGLIDGYMLRHKVRPGITGWAQVNGLRGETETLDQMKKRIAFDLDYLRHWSPWIDLKILWRTLWVVFRDRNAY